MTRRQVRHLRPGDEVQWTDPDGGRCSRVLIIGEIEPIGTDGDAVRITDRDGDVLECYVKELS